MEYLESSSAEAHANNFNRLDYYDYGAAAMAYLFVNLCAPANDNSYKYIYPSDI